SSHASHLIVSFRLSIASRRTIIPDMDMSASTPRTLPTYFLSHGGGPWPFMKAELGNAYAALEASLANLPNELVEKPAAILMISAHWETKDFTVMAGERPGMIYDY